VVFIFSFLAAVIMFYAKQTRRDTVEWEKWRGLAGAINNDVQHLRKRFAWKKENV
jgi:hypothetical protein